MELLERHFEIALETPDGIKKLRKLILSFAMQGKLVPQDPTDQPARELLSEIEVEKKKLISEGIIKKQISLPPIEDSEIPYKLPKSWKWVRLNDIFDVRDGTHDTPKYVNDGYPLITSKNLYTGSLNFDDIKYISEEDHLRIQERSKVDIGDILFAMIGSIGNPVIVDTDKEFSIKNVALIKYYTKTQHNRAFLLQYLILAQENMKAKASGAVQSFVSLGFLRNYLFPLPPLKEQKRIVEKVEQLMTLCDKMEAERNERNKIRLTIHTAAMERLLTSLDTSAFNSSWSFIANQFNSLYSVIDNVTDLKKAILQLAVMGKLVPQDPHDQPASELLKEIEAKKKKLNKEGKIKKQEPLPHINDNEIPYTLPSSWEWVRLNMIADYNGRQNASPDEISPHTWVLDLEDIEKDTSKILNRITNAERQSKSTKSTFCKGDVLYGKLRPYLNKVVVADQEGVCTTEIVPIVPSFGVLPEYLKLLLKRPDFLSYVNELSYGVKMPRLGTTDAVKSVHPLPPLNEQRRIVEKVNQLIELCNSLVEQIKDSTDKQSAIFDAVLAKLEVIT